MLALDNIKQEIKKELLSDLEERQLSDTHLYQEIDTALLNRKELALREKLYLRTAVFDSFRRLDLLSELLDDPGITEIMINGPDEIFVEKKGQMEKWDKTFQSTEQLSDLIQQIVSRINRAVNTTRGWISRSCSPSAYCSERTYRNYSKVSGTHYYGQADSTRKLK